MTIGQRVAQKRKELGLSQEALGDQLGVSRQSIYKWESDTTLPEIDKLIALRSRRRTGRRMPEQTPALFRRRGLES